MQWHNLSRQENENRADSLCRGVIEGKANRAENGCRTKGKGSAVMRTGSRAHSGQRASMQEEKWVEQK